MMVECYTMTFRNGSLAQWPTENVLQISHWTITAIPYTSMRSLFSVVLKRKFFNTFYLLLIITRDHVT